MRRSDSITTLAKALVLAKKEMEAPKKNKTVKITDTRSYSYADLAGVKDSYQEAIGKHGLGVLHAIAPVDGHLVLTTTLLHESGEWIASEYPIPAFPKPQEQGSALTYFKRYNVCALLDIVAEDDDDGTAAQEGAAKAASTEKPPTTPAADPNLISREQVEQVHTLAKKAGYKTSAELAPFLTNLVRVSKATDILKTDLTVVVEALTSMAARPREAATA